LSPVGHCNQGLTDLLYLSSVLKPDRTTAHKTTQVNCDRWASVTHDHATT